MTRLHRRSSPIVTSRTPDVDTDPNAAALAPMVQVWSALLAAHLPDRDRRCVACRWQTRAADRWPCDIYLLAAAAQRVATTPPGLGR
jgi:hypothetical protein